jgi:hypothetical protein
MPVTKKARAPRSFGLHYSLFDILFFEAVLAVVQGMKGMGRL